MTTPTASDLIDRLRHAPELLEAIRQQLNSEAKDNTSLVAKPASRRPDNTERDNEIVAKVHAGTHTRADIAREYQLSLPRINQIMQLHPHPNPVKVNPNAERDAKIVAKARAKVPRWQLAQEFNLSVIRINQIVGAAPKVKKLSVQDKAREALRKYDAYEDLTFEEDCLIMVFKYPEMAKKITKSIVAGTPPTIIHQWEFPADHTGGDINWTPEHYTAVSHLLYNFDHGTWKEYDPL